MAVDAVVFDVGETLVDESRAWLDAAARSGVPPFTLMGVLGGLAAERRDHRLVWELTGAERVAPTAIELRDFYPDALPCLERLTAGGLRLGLAGNQPESAADDLRACGIQVELIATSVGWGVDKPARAFFERVCTELALPPARIAYVGDRVDNDVEPALALGMIAVHVRRGPWGHLQEPPVAAIRIESLDELPAALP